MPHDPPSLFARNREAFRTHCPELWAELEKIGELASTLVVEDGKAVNVDLGNVRLYPKSAPVLTADQLDHYFRGPDRIKFRNPVESSLSKAAICLNQAIAADLEELGERELAEEPVADIGYAFVFGIGLGYHIPELVRRNLCRRLILIEPIPEFILHSMSAIDWQWVFREAGEKGMEIDFRVGKNPERTLLEIEGLLIHSRGTPFLDGSYAYVHYFSWALREARLLLNEKVMNFLVRPGKFEDEVPMMENAFANLRKWSFSLVDDRPFIRREMPVFIIGSGPSLDKDLPFIKSLRDRAVVVSCGSSLGILLKLGIRPDLHVENENTLPLVENLKGFHRQYGFADIRLIASITVDPEVGGLFDERWFYYRAPLSPSTLLLDSSDPLLYAGPLVANAAATVAATVGFGNIYLFGVDCGRREGQGHHCRDAVYYHDGYDNYIEGESSELLERELEREVPGNFGGKIFTSAYYDLSRRTFTELQRRHGFNFMNCSDGAKIDAARPISAAAVRLENPPNQQKTVLNLIEEQLRSYAGGDLLAAVDLRRHEEACGRFIDAFQDLMEKAVREDGNFWELARRIEKFKQDQGQAFDGVLKLIGGSMALFLRMGTYNGIRIADETARRKFFSFFAEHFREACVATAREARFLVQGLMERAAETGAVGSRRVKTGELPIAGLGPGDSSHSQ